MDFLQPTTEYLGVPNRSKSLVDEFRSADIFQLDQSVINDPNGTYRQIEVAVTAPNDPLVPGSDIAEVAVPFDGTLVAVTGRLRIASTAGPVQASLVTFGDSEILSGYIQIEENGYKSLESASQPAIDPRYAYFGRDDSIRIRVDSAGTGSKGLLITLYFVAGKFYYGG